jgi:hypothetical protein
MWTTITFLCLIALLALIIVIFVNTSPQFGQKPQAEDLTRIKQSVHYNEKGFVNLTETTTGDIWEALKKIPEMLAGGDRIPHKPLPVAFPGAGMQTVDSATYITWFGHSAFLLELQGRRILIDPMLGEFASPTTLGSKRFAYQKPIPLEQLKNIDVVVISMTITTILIIPPFKKFSMMSIILLLHWVWVHT